MTSPANSTALAELCALLRLDTVPTLPLALTHFEQWKLLIDRVASAQRPHAAELARLIVVVADETDDDVCLGMAHWISGNVFYYLNQPRKALVQYDQAEVIYTARQEPLQIARMHVGKFGALKQLGQYQRALDLAQTTLRLLQESSLEVDQVRVVKTYNNIGGCYEEMGRFVEAVEAYERKWHWWRSRTGSEAEIESARAQVNLSVAKIKLGQYDEARDTLMHIRQTLSRHLDDDLALRTLMEADVTSVWLEVCARNHSARVTEQIRIAYQNPGFQLHRSQSSQSSVLLHLQLNELEWKLHSSDWNMQDRQRLIEVRDGLANHALAYETAYAEIMLGYAWLREGAVTQAEHEFNLVRQRASERGDVEMAYQAGLGLARAQKLAGHPLDASRTLVQALDSMEQTRAQINVGDFRASYLEDKLAAYQELALLQIGAGDMTSAFVTTERAKARTLADLLSPMSEQIGSDVTSTPSRDAKTSDADASSIDRLRRDLAEPDSLLPDERKGIERQLTDLLRTHEQQTGRWARYTTRVASLEAVCPALPRGTLVISYAVLNGEIWAFALDRNGSATPPTKLGAALDAVTLPSQLSRITNIARLPQNQSRQFAAQHIHSAQAPLAAWHAQFIAPLRKAIDFDKYDRLLISPDGLLNRLPFACLFDAAQQRYLVETHDVVIIPSLTTWMLLQGATRRTAQQDLPRGGQAVIVGCSAGGKVPHAVEEAQQVAHQLGHATVLLETDATRDRFAQATRNADLVYIATHGLCRPDAPAFSFLEFADGRLEVFDISQLTLNAGTVILSACETGLGKLSGNEMMGLVRAFLHAGASDVVAMQWPVADEATRYIMCTALEHWAGNGSIARAVCQSQRRCLRQQLESVNGSMQALSAHPYYWGALTVIGGGSACAKYASIDV